METCLSILFKIISTGLLLQLIRAH